MWFMASRLQRKPAEVTPLPSQIGGQQRVVETHSKAVEAGDSSPKRAAALIAARRHLIELQNKLKASLAKEHDGPVTELQPPW